MGDFIGLAGFDSELLERPRALLPGLQIDLQQLIGDATECAVRWQLSGIYPSATAPTETGAPAELRTEGTTWFRFEGALIAEVWTYWDGAVLFAALGSAQDAA